MLSSNTFATKIAGDRLDPFCHSANIRIFILSTTSDSVNIRALSSSLNSKHQDADVDDDAEKG